MITRISSIVLLSLLWISCGIACRGPARPADLPKLYPASITLTQEGRPVSGALVSLFPDGDPAAFKWSIAAITDASGTAVLMTHGKYSGAPEGIYKVVIHKTENSNASEPAKSHSPETEDSSKMAKSATLYNLVETKYTAVATTPLTITIGKGKNAQSFDLGKSVREKGETIVF